MLDCVGRIVVIILFAGFGVIRGYGQLSPGPLANAHKHLEGVSNCTQCHTIGERVSNEKCLQCHQEIKSRTDKNRGFHSSQEVRSKDCATCHSDHNGRNFEMIRFDEKKFNHNNTGYDLTGGHQKVDCRNCHKSDWIEDAELKKRSKTYLGLKQECKVCHKDYHQKTLDSDCSKCHTTEHFIPADRFNHDKTKFALAGKHKTVACIECHQKETRNGESFQKFSGIAFKNCNSCHTDPHQNHLGTTCKECHVEQSFDALGGLQRFNHARTDFPLKGRHKKLDCKACHNLEVGPKTVFQDRKAIPPENCIACHKDVHEGKFGTDCASCHTEEGFRKVGDLEAFDHAKTRFALEGKHQTVDCKKCHTSDRMTDPVRHNTCADCHSDFHERQFESNGVSPDCAKCHTTDGFTSSKYSIEEHAHSRFPLDGAHVATPCLACHKRESKWAFRNLGERCVDCHKDVHNGQIDAKWYPNQECKSCHQTSAWPDSRFDHSKTRFVLKGKHREVQCRDCHKPEPEYAYGKFAGLDSRCQQCHEDAHQRQFEEKGVTNCAKCHGNDAWKIAEFDHDKTKFKLEGKHVTVACDACHKTRYEGEKAVVQYKFESFECVVCHQ